MSRTLGGLAAILLAVPQLGASDEAKPAASQVKALQEEYRQAQEAFLKQLKAAKTDAARKEAQKRSPDTRALARRLFRVAAEQPSEPATLDAYTWVLSHVYG